MTITMPEATHRPCVGCGELLPMEDMQQDPQQDGSWWCDDDACWHARTAEIAAVAGCTFCGNPASVGTLCAAHHQEAVGRRAWVMETLTRRHQAAFAT